MVLVLINIYHLYNIFKTKDSFNTLEIQRDNRYLVAFINYYKNIRRRRKFKRYKKDNNFKAI